MQFLYESVQATPGSSPSICAQTEEVYTVFALIPGFTHVCPYCTLHWSKPVSCIPPPRHRELVSLILNLSTCKRCGVDHWSRHLLYPPLVWPGRLHCSVHSYPMGHMRLGRYREVLCSWCQQFPIVSPLMPSGCNSAK